MSCKNAQKLLVKIVNFVHTYLAGRAIIIPVKTPQYIIYFLLYPIVKIPSPKKAAFEAVFFTVYLYSWRNLK